MKFIITAHPIDRKFQEKLGIYSSCEVKSQSVGRILKALAKKGYTEMNSYYDRNREILSFHCADKSIYK
jgi:hypothetical protein